MLKAMRSTTFAEDGGQDQSMYYDMLDEKLAKVVTEQGGLGLAEHIARQMGSSGTARPTGEQTQPVADLGTASECRQCCGPDWQQQTGRSRPERPAAAARLAAGELQQNAGDVDSCR